MEDENKVDVDTSIDNEEIVLDIDEDDGDEKTDREKKLEEIARNQKIRAEKAEKEAKETKELLKNSSKSGDKKEEALSTGDLYALMSAKVPEDDVEEVVRIAKLLGKSVKESLKDEAVATILKTRQSYRDTANATNKGATRPSSKVISSDEILKNASKGIIPEQGSTEAEELFWARRGGKR